jgi:hypothetical protein
MEVIEAPVEGDVVPFPREDMVIRIFGRHPSPKKRLMPDPSMGTPARGGQGWGDENVRAQIFLYLNIYEYIYICTLHTPQKQEKGKGMAGGRPEAIVTLDRLSIRFMN